jgi:hypothetical protein
MAIEFSCDCGQKFRVSDEHAGKKTKCKACGSTVAIPRSAPAKAGPQGANPKAGKPIPKSARKEEELFLLELADEDESGGDNDFDFALEEVPQQRRLPGKPGAKKKKKVVDPADEDDKPRRKKKQSGDESGLPKPALIAVLAVLGLAGVTGAGFALVKAIGGGAEAAKPLEKQYVLFEHELGSFKIEHPSDWQARGAGGNGGVPPSVQIEGDDAYFNAKGSIGGAAIGDMASAGAGMADFGIPGEDEAEDAGGIDLSPVASVHEYQKTKRELELNDYEESPPEKIESGGFGEGRLSLFTASKGFGSRIKGFRGTFLATDYQYNLFCHVPERQFDRYEPIFRKMIASFTR